MKECLHCKKEFQEKKDTAKYCSVSCRVMFNRKHKVKALKFAAASNNTLLADLVEKVDRLLGERINYAPTTPNSFDSDRINTFRRDEASQWQEPKFSPKMSVADYVQERLQCDDVDSFNKWERKLEADLNLSQKEKQLAKTATLN